ncbi:MAG: hypothetical protein GXY86_12145 [Firmicutes bacterium]|nr:hypothetical protein [Bacillota bacterium]
MLLTDKEEVIIATIATTGYLPRAMVMAKSVKKHMPETKVIVCIVEEKIPQHTNGLSAYFDKVILAKNLGFPTFINLSFNIINSKGLMHVKPNYYFIY